MCISAQPANFSNTHLYAGEALYNNELVHVMGYQNKAVSDGPNAMLLPIPTDKSMSKDNLIDCRDFPEFMVDIAAATRLQTFSDKMSKSVRRGFAAASFQIFDSGSYTVVLASSVNGILEALNVVPKEKRPELSKNLLNGMCVLYPDHTFALCCWNGNIEAEPILLWYSPKDKDYLFAPALDAHDGDSPNPRADVNVDHYISFSTLNMDKSNANRVYYEDGVSYKDGKEFFIKPHELCPEYVVGTKLNTVMKNGDFFKKTNLKRKAVRKPPLKKASSQVVMLNGWD